MPETAARARARSGERGSLLLLDHCARLDRLTGARGRSARERLEAELGADLARRLLGTLCAGAGGRSVGGTA